jgi:acetyl-CoA C-acetyltransferase
MNEVAVMTGAVRTPIGRRNGGLAGVHPADLLARVLRELIQRTGIDPSEVGQVVGGCVNAVGEQAYNITRTAWLSAGLPASVAGTTVDAQCGSGQQAVDLAIALVASGTVEIAIGCGVESMSRVPLGSSSDAGPGTPLPLAYYDRYNWISQFEAAERIAVHWAIGRIEADTFALESQNRAAKGWMEGRFDREVLPIEVDDLDEHGASLGTKRLVTADEGIRESTLEGLGRLKSVSGANGIHTAGNSSQISDAAAAVLIMSRNRAKALNLEPLAKVVDHGMVGSDPVLKLTGPIPATHHVLERTRLTIRDLDVIEINEAFASVVLAWEREFRPDMGRVNPSGGAIALGHPLGGSGARLITTALFELERTDQSTALVTMCCGGGLGTATLLERV